MSQIVEYLIWYLEETNLHHPLKRVHEIVFPSIWYKDIFSYFQTLECPSYLNKEKSRSFKLHATKYCIIDEKIYLKDTLGVLLNCMVEE